MKGLTLHTYKRGSIEGMKVAILGYARDGKAAYEYWSKSGHGEALKSDGQIALKAGEGAFGTSGSQFGAASEGQKSNEITICDEDANKQYPEGVKTQLGEGWLKNLDQFDILVRTAGLQPSKITAANPNSPNILNKVTGNINEFFRVCPTKNIIGVTGTKGKGTTSTLIAKMLEADGKKVYLGGNIGIPALELLKENIQPEDWIVLEQSSFQLIDQKYSPHIAVCLMVVQEHMDWHKDMGEYLNAKKQLFAHQKPDDIAIYKIGDANSMQIASVSAANKIPYFAPPGAYVEDKNIKIGGQIVCAVDDLKLLGRHNWQNACAAVTSVWQVTQNVQAIKSILETFTGLEHRLEFVRELAGVKYYDDSFGTTPETAIVAIQAFTQPKVVVLGGSDKGSDYNQLAKVVASSGVKSAVLIGKMAPKIKEALAGVGFDSTVEGGETMTDIVNAARQQATAGDVVLLSTACASFGLFKDYKDRGEQFKQTVQALA